MTGVQKKLDKDKFTIEDLVDITYPFNENIEQNLKTLINQYNIFRYWIEKIQKEKLLEDRFSRNFAIEHLKFLEAKIKLMDEYFKYLYGLELKLYNMIYFEEQDMINMILESYYAYRKEIQNVEIVVENLIEWYENPKLKEQLNSKLEKHLNLK